MSRDFRDLLFEFTARNVEFLVVGAHALAAYGHVRATKDLDVWVRPSDVNGRRVLEALVAFGAPIEDLSLEDLTTPGTTFQIGVDPLRIDILTEIDGVSFDEAWENRCQAELFGQSAFVISKEDLIRNKKASGRLQDLADVERLEGER